MKDTLMSTELMTLQLSPIEEEIVKGSAEGYSVVDLSVNLGLPKSTITNTLKKPKIKKYLDEMIKARNQSIQMHLPNLLMEILGDKVAKVKEDPEARLADITRKDVVDIAKVLNELTKSSQDTEKETNNLVQIYNQLGVTQ